MPREMHGLERRERAAQRDKVGDQPREVRQVGPLMRRGEASRQAHRPARGRATEDALGEPAAQAGAEEVAGAHHQSPHAPIVAGALDHELEFGAQPALARRCLLGRVLGKRAIGLRAEAEDIAGEDQQRAGLAAGRDDLGRRLAHPRIPLREGVGDGMDDDLGARGRARECRAVLCIAREGLEPVQRGQARGIPQQAAHRLAARGELARDGAAEAAARAQDQYPCPHART